LHQGFHIGCLRCFVVSWVVYRDRKPRRLADKSARQSSANVLANIRRRCKIRSNTFTDRAMRMFIAGSGSMTETEFTSPRPATALLVKSIRSRVCLCRADTPSDTVARVCDEQVSVRCPLRQTGNGPRRPPNTSGQRLSSRPLAAHDQRRAVFVGIAAPVIKCASNGNHIL